MGSAVDETANEGDSSEVGARGVTPNEAEAAADNAGNIAAHMAVPPLMVR